MTTYQNYGGNRSIDWDPAAEIQTFSIKDIFIKFQTLQLGQTYHLPAQGSFTVTVANCDTGAEIELLQYQDTLKRGDTHQLNNTAESLRAKNGKCDLVIAGTNSSGIPSSSSKISSLERYTVTKPWGYEYWLSYQHPSYVLKEIFIQRNARTSLQYHKIKEEINVLYIGEARLIYNSTEDQLASVVLAAKAIIHIPPTTIHRFEAISDIHVYELSTPHLDDVVRLNDDTGRPDGYIDGEHGTLNS
jgi:mannose-6-phosphate isomerase